jgi:hypothetical protein
MIHVGFKKHLSRFFFVEVGNKQKYHWFTWPDICHPKEKGGLGFLNSMFLSITLMNN